MVFACRPRDFEGDHDFGVEAGDVLADEIRCGVETQPVDAGQFAGVEVVDPAVLVGEFFGEGRPVGVGQGDRHACGGQAAAGVQNVGADLRHGLSFDNSPSRRCRLIFLSSSRMTPRSVWGSLSILSVSFSSSSSALRPLAHTRYTKPNLSSYARFLSASSARMAPSAPTTPACSRAEDGLSTATPIRGWPASAASISASGSDASTRSACSSSASTPAYGAPAATRCAHIGDAHTSSSWSTSRLGIDPESGRFTLFACRMAPLWPVCCWPPGQGRATACQKCLPTTADGCVPA